MKHIVTLLTLLFFTVTAEASDKLTVLLDWYANPNHAPLFIAEQQGYFKAQDLNVTFIGPSDPTDPPKLVAAGKADIAITYQPAFDHYISKSLPLIQIGTLIDSPLNCLVVLDDSTIQSIKDLKGKRIGYSSDSTQSDMLKLMLAKQGLTLNDVELVNVHYNLTQALLTRHVDAVVGMMRNIELIELNLLGHPGRAFYPEQNGMPSYSELIFSAKKSNQFDSRFARFMTAVNQGKVYLRQHPNEAWNSFVKQHPELDNEFNHQAWIETIHYFK